jgi:hypothetical protein
MMTAICVWFSATARAACSCRKRCRDPGISTKVSSQSRRRSVQKAMRGPGRVLPLAWNSSAKPPLPRQNTNVCPGFKLSSTRPPAAGQNITVMLPATRLGPPENSIRVWGQFRLLSGPAMLRLATAPARFLARRIGVGAGKAGWNFCPPCSPSRPKNVPTHVEIIDYRTLTEGYLAGFDSEKWPIFGDLVRAY